MKKITAFLILLSLLTALLSGCGCKHDWIEADCTEPETCSLCGETQGDALGHRWKKATCTAPKTCRYCGKTKGDPTGHNPGPMSEQIDEVKNLRLEEQRCTECDQVLVSEISTLYYSYSDGDLFLFSAESFMERMAYLASENGMALSYEFTDQEGFLVVFVTFSGAESWEGSFTFFEENSNPIRYSDSSVPGLWYITIGSASELNQLGDLIPSELFELFCMACDPQMDADAFQTLDLLRLDSFMKFAEFGETSGYGDHNGLQYKYEFYTFDSIDFENILFENILVYADLR